MPKPLDLTGQTFGRLVVLGRDTSVKAGHGTHWLCQCTCGNMTTVRNDCLKAGTIASCGCLGVERRRSGKLQKGHGMCGTPEHNAWLSLRKRCRNPKDGAYHRYGGRGITVCERWESFMAFYADVGPRPGPGYSLDRVDNNGDYEPGNVRWVTHVEQMNNFSGNHLVTWNGETKSVQQWSCDTGIPAHVIQRRLSRDHWTVEKALTTQVAYGATPPPLTQIRIALHALLHAPAIQADPSLASAVNVLRRALES